ncbi:MAG: glycine cleavage T C-terminal barrel domain-containing protein, partial [Terriglobia bacterium]
SEPQTLPKLLEHLDKFIIGDDVTLEDLTPALATIAVEGPKSPDVMAAAGAPMLESAYGANAQWGPALVARLSLTGETGFFVIVDVAEKDEILRKIAFAGAVPADEDAFRVVRLEHGKPHYGEDITERYLAQEANQPQAMHFHKGCYLGQEIVERLRSRGLISRVLVALEIEGQQPPESGTRLQIGGASVAEITSAAYSPALGKVVAMGYVRADRAEPGTEMGTGQLRARVRSLQ